ncbi:general stress protein [Heyndrickxia coagulans]|uniref:general stress protein n=1 Tax=Heyndrickxia coagulans TaxID=1398 RepID=UPI0002F7AE1E|nr:general stress protein [Heyndrickxia coagulans]
MHKIEVVENGLEATNKITEFENEGFSKDNIYIFSHDKNRSKDLTDATETRSVGMEEQGVVDSVGNLLRERGDELRSKMQALGLSEMEAVQYEKLLDEGRVVVIATDNQEEPEHLL